MKDVIVEQVVDKYQRRSELGLMKYGTTLAQNNHDDFLEHALEEAMDFTLYLMKIKNILKSKGYNKLEEIPNIK
jgi:uncharacterized protein (UPF0297 family)